MTNLHKELDAISKKKFTGTCFLYYNFKNYLLVIQKRIIIIHTLFKLVLQS